MILISAGLVLTAVVLLIAGVVIAKPFLVMWSIAVSVLSAVFLVIGALLRRHELFPGGGRAGAAPPSPFKGPAPAGPMPVPPMTPHRQPAPGIPGVHAGPPEAAPQGARQTVAAATRPRPAPAAGPASARQGALDAEAIVLVIPGRRRYHVAGCRQLAGREHEELTHEEAREEGFTPCTTCLPELSGGIAPQDAPEGREAAQAPLPAPPAQALRESGTTGPDSGETVRFTPPYRPAGTSGNQAGRPRTPSGEPEAPLRESREQPASAPRAEKAAAPFAAPSFPLQMPSPASAEDSSATSWFSREPASPPASRPGPAAPDTRSSEPGEQDAPVREAAEQDAPEQEASEPAPREETPGSRTAAGQDAPESGEQVEEEPSPAGSAPLAESAEPVGAARAAEPAEPAEPTGPEPTTGSAVRSEPAESTERTEPASTGSAEPGRPVGAGSADETSGPGNGGPGNGGPETTGPEADRPETETDGRPETESAPAGSAPLAEAAEPVGAARAAEPAEPVEPAGTEQPGRAGRPVPVGSTSAGPGEPVPSAQEEGIVPDDARDDDTSPHGIPAVKAGAAGSGTVKVISGTRRFHGVACPLVRGVDDDGIETMSRAEAEEAGLSGCAVCQGDVPDRG
ncbi:hypothetical protein [Planomonospora parontospora]|uniref:hypothetical protein n=1 Tax=Planomonospora parontospora TaxID=58119 RepID=UPI00167081A5|nr:hypothetical protein [Planomonospora parontospora]GGL20337.1 hypothetical protein GCM10014719_23100 [Planomonospora parontospora subsp. antibiotica]GII13616.1 hypothetical protein Ppa05_03420 [Planomonospora parontospora subsp. antibiotica]